MLHPSRLSFAACWLAALLLVPAFGAAQAAPKLAAGAPITDCTACHGADQVLPAKHPAIKGQTLTECRACHAPASDKRLKLSMAHTHQLAGATCESCHGKGQPATPETSQCTSCHDLKSLVAKTTSVKPKNPHTSPHYGPELDCDNCHVAHGRSRDYCQQCHEFKFRVP